MRRHWWGAALWVLCVLTFPAQFLAATQWPQPYSWGSNTISDLGVTTCATFDAGTQMERYICSPGHPVANAGTVVNGALLAVGAVLLWSAWPRRRAGHAAMALIAASGVLLMLVGFLPWDQQPEAHNLAALVQAPVQWAGMTVLVFALRGSTALRWASVMTIFCVAVSIAGFVMFIDAIGGGPSRTLGVGLTERLSFDTLTLWSVVLGLILLPVRERLRVG